MQTGIIELSDGRVIRDDELAADDAVQASEAKGLAFCDNCVEIPAGYHLTPEDREKINSYIDALFGAKYAFDYSLCQSGGTLCTYRYFADRNRFRRAVPAYSFASAYECGVPFGSKQP